MNDESKKQKKRDCTTCSIFDADVCRSCIAKAVRAEEYPLWKEDNANEWEVDAWRAVV